MYFMPNFMAEMGVVGLGSNTMRDSVVVGRIGKRKGETKRHRSHHELFSGGTGPPSFSFFVRSLFGRTVQTLPAGRRSVVGPSGAPDPVFPCL